MTEQELAQIVEQAEARRGWKFVGDAKIQMVKGWCFHCGTNEQAQFILDTIRAIPVLWAIIEQKSRALGGLCECWKRVMGILRIWGNKYLN